MTVVFVVVAGSWLPAAGQLDDLIPAATPASLFGPADDLCAVFINKSAASLSLEAFAG